MSETKERSAAVEQRVEATHERAVRVAEDTVAALRATGWDFAAVSVAVALPLGGGKATAPGASRFDGDPRLMQAFPHLADALRVMARELDDAHKRSGQPERETGYHHVQERPAVRACRSCGCTDYDCRGCIAKTGAPCFWVAHDLCSACAAATIDGTAPQTMAERWREFEREVELPAENVVARVAMRRAFYAGACSLMDVAPVAPRTTAIVDELREFAASVDRGQA
jgi:hypothetical protein